MEYLKNLYQRIKLMRKEDLLDIKYAAIVLLVVFLVLGLINKAYAGEWFKEPTYMFLGIDYEKHQNVCYKDRGTEVGHMGFGIPVYSADKWDARLQYTHLSCAFSPDRGYADNVGFTIFIRP